MLVLNIAGIGDFVDSTPALHALRRARPDARITLMVAEKVHPLAIACPYIDEVVALPTALGRGLPAWWTLPRWLWQVLPLRHRFSLVVNLYEVSSRKGGWLIRALLAWLDAPVSIGRNAHGCAPYYTWVLLDDHAPQDNVACFLKIVSLIPGVQFPVTAEPPPVELWIPDSIVDSMRQWCESTIDWGELQGPLVVVALGGDRQTRHEFPERAGQWLQRLQEEFGIRPIIWGMQRDPLPACSKPLRYLTACGRFDLIPAAALIACADLVVTTQSSAQHLASVWRKPTVVLGGPADPAKHRPHLPAERLRILYHRVDCSPCSYRHCPLLDTEQKKCLKAFSVEDVVDACRELLSSAVGRGRSERLDSSAVV